MTKYDFSRLKNILDDINTCEKDMRNLESSISIKICNSMNNDVIVASLGENRELHDLLVPVIKEYYKNKYANKKADFEKIEIDNAPWSIE